MSPGPCEHRSQVATRTQSVQASGAYVPRLLERRLEAFLGELPGVLLVGPRAVGKTTTAQRYARSVVRLDRDSDAVAFRADPDSALRVLSEPVLLDEWQLVPGVLGAVKRAIDEDSRPGRFLVTGSVRAELDQPSWPGTGRLVRLTLPGLTVREQRGASEGPSLPERVATGGVEAALAPVSDPPDLRAYLELGLASGFPEAALRLGPEAREAWLDSYVQQLLTRDVELVDGGRDRVRLRRYLQAYAAVTAQVVDDKTLWEAAGVNRRTALAYERLLEDLFIIESLPAWSTNRLKQLVRSPKRHVFDPAVAAAVLGLDADTLMRRGELLGPIIETFAVSQLRAEALGSRFRLRLHHLRTRGGRHEVDLLIELAAGRVLGVEIKASAAPTPRDARHLRWLAESLPDRFAGGLVLHTGPRSYRLGPDIVACPIAALWG